MSYASLGASAGDFTQHSKVAFCFVTLMSPLRHHPLILKPLMFSSSSRLKDRSWWKPSLFKVCVQVLSLVFHTTQFSVSCRVVNEVCLSRSSMESHAYIVLGSSVPHQHSSFLDADGKKTGVSTAGSPCIRSRSQICRSARRMCLEGVSLIDSSRYSWTLQEA